MDSGLKWFSSALTFLITGTPTKLDDVRAAIQASTPDAVIVALNACRTSDSPFAAPISPPQFMADCNGSVVVAMKEFSVQNLVIMQAFAVGASWPHMPCVMSGLMSKTNMSYQYDDHNHTVQEVQASGFTWVMVRPTRLVETDDMTVHE
ncbi:TrkA-N domain dehydrogenase [Penicillium chermesinum]|uniref:TrkA-N domain dehydrogenase n=1 Tax=Penicillium chermesinum TaxID=63820 RepID=A0A9W9PFT9_9EURO|nr:TrkA-N domain dehydrogenase [Penicillium chermesinum]KAJ5246048.1 TrkA-N domain dehydrogenase [Penicillium chermesinum]